METKKIIIGTRGSRLSVIQTHIIKDLLQAILPEAIIEITTITTSGDINLSPIPLDTVGKGWFTKEIDRQLLEGKIDLAVHSLKDLLDTLTTGLSISAIPEREDPSEALVSRNNATLETLRKGAVIGTDSIRRKMQILKIRDDVVVKSVRGNVDKRLSKLDSGEYDALILAVAGLKRLGLEKRITQYFDPTKFIPSPGQGALAVVTRKNNMLLNNVVSKLNHTSSISVVTAERSLSKALGGGCSMPVGAYAEIKEDILELYGMLGSEDEKHLVKGRIKGNKYDPEGLAEKLAEKLLHQAPWNKINKSSYVVLTRVSQENEALARQLELLGLHPLKCPSITVSKNLSKKSFKAYLDLIATYQWIIFTSSNGVKYFIEGLRDIGLNVTLLQHTKIAVIGEKTAEIARSYGLSISHIPQKFTAKDIIKTLSNIQKQNILLPRSTIANTDIKTHLEEKGAIVTEMPVYKTNQAKFPTKALRELLQKKQISCLTFTSPSTVEGFLKNIDNNLMNNILTLPVISIGPFTTKAARKKGFVNINTASTHTIEGVLSKLKESIL